MALSDLRPGVAVSTLAAPARANAAVAIGTWYVVGLTERGPLTPTLSRPIQSLADYTDTYGARVTYGALYDSLEVFFAQGGRLAYVARVVGPTPTVATLTLVDRAGTPVNTLRVDAANPGSWGTRVTVQVTDGVAANTYVLKVYLDAVLKEQSPDLATPADAVTWAASTSTLIVVTDLASGTASPSNNPAVIGATALVGGDDDRANITETEWTAATARHPAAFGPGLVSQPGRVTSTAHLQVITHAAANNRLGVLDAADGASAATTVTLASTVQAGTTSDEYGALFAPWLRMHLSSTPGGSLTSVPPSAVAAGLISQQAGANIAEPAAGTRGVTTGVAALAQTAFTPTEINTLTLAGVNTFTVPYGATAVTLYGDRTLAISSNPQVLGPWTQTHVQVMRLQLTHEAHLIGEQFVHRVIDGRGVVFAEFAAALDGMLRQYWLTGALYGDTTADAYRVDTSAAVNTPTTIAAGELHATIAVRLSPAAELVVIQIVKSAADQALG